MHRVAGEAPPSSYDPAELRGAGECALVSCWCSPREPRQPAAMGERNGSSVSEVY